MTVFLVEEFLQGEDQLLILVDGVGIGVQFFIPQCLWKRNEKFCHQRFENKILHTEPRKAVTSLETMPVTCPYKQIWVLQKASQVDAESKLAQHCKRERSKAGSSDLDLNTIGKHEIQEVGKQISYKWEKAIVFFSFSSLRHWYDWGVGIKTRTKPQGPIVLASRLLHFKYMKICIGNNGIGQQRSGEDPRNEPRGENEVYTWQVYSGRERRSPQSLPWIMDALEWGGIPECCCWMHSENQERLPGPKYNWHQSSKPCKSPCKLDKINLCAKHKIIIQCGSNFIDGWIWAQVPHYENRGRWIFWVVSMHVG